VRASPRPAILSCIQNVPRRQPRRSDARRSADAIESAGRARRSPRGRPIHRRPRRPEPAVRGVQHLTSWPSRGRPARHDDRALVYESACPVAIVPHAYQRHEGGVQTIGAGISAPMKDARRRTSTQSSTYCSTFRLKGCSPPGTTWTCSASARVPRPRRGGRSPQRLAQGGRAGGLPPSRSCRARRWRQPMRC
jgi:hypothetical protein